MPKKKRGFGFDKRKVTGRHLRYGYVPKKTSKVAPDPELLSTDEQQDDGIQLTVGKDNTDGEASKSGECSTSPCPAPCSASRREQVSSCLQNVLPELLSTDKQQDDEMQWTVLNDNDDDSNLVECSASIHPAPCSTASHEQLAMGNPVQIFEEHSYFNICAPSLSVVHDDEISLEMDDRCESPKTNESQQTSLKSSDGRQMLIEEVDIEMAASFSGGNAQVSPLLEEESLEELLLEVSRHVNMFMPSQCVCAVVDGELDIGFAAPSIQIPATTTRTPFAIQRAATITPSGEVKVFVHNKPLPSCHKIWNAGKKIRLLSTTVHHFSENVLGIINSIRSYSICGGVQDFEKCWKSCEAGFVDNPFLETRYSKTFRSLKCLYLVDGSTYKRCQECASLCLVLRQRHSRKKTQSLATSPANKGNKYLTTPQKYKRLERNRKTIRNLREQNARLRKVCDLLRKEGVDIEPELSKDLSSILNDPGNFKNLTTLQKLFLEGQVKASRLKNKKSMRWHPMMIRLALQIKAASSVAYEDLRNVLHLPSERQLFYYSHCMDVAGSVPECNEPSVSKAFKTPKPNSRLI